MSLTATTFSTDLAVLGHRPKNPLVTLKRATYLALVYDGLARRIARRQSVGLGAFASFDQR